MVRCATDWVHDAVHRILGPRGADGVCARSLIVAEVWSPQDSRTFFGRHQEQAIAQGQNTPPPPGAKKKSLKFPAPLINFIFLPEEKFSDVGGWVGRPGLARAPNNPPAPPPWGHEAMA